MMLKKYIFTLSLLFILCCGIIKPAAAISFADFAYQKAAQNKTEEIRPYLRKGYRIDTPDTKGNTALCRSVQKENYNAYQKLRRLGANPGHFCMRNVNQQTATDFANRYQPKNFAPIAEESQTNSNLKYAGAGVLAVGAAAGAVALLDNGGGSKHSYSHAIPSCPSGYIMVNGKCELISCEAGTHWVNGKCEPLNCPEGTIVYGNTCIEETKCPIGESWNGEECVAIVCPDNTHLVGNACVADQINIDNKNDNDIIAINSDLDKVYNLRSTPDHPDNESVIKINNKGNGNVTGINGRSDIFNAVVVKERNGYSNPLYNGTGIINITNHGSGDVRGIHAQIKDITQYKQAMNAAAEHNGIANGYININHTGGGNTYGIQGDVRAYNAYAIYGGTSNGNITIHGDGNIYGIYGYVAATNAVSPFYGHKVTGNINLYGNSKGSGDIYGMMISKDDVPGAGAGDGNINSWFAFNAYTSGGDEVEGNINIRQYGNGNVYGLYGGQQLYNASPFAPESSIARGNINILNAGNGDAFGMYIPDQDSDAVIFNADTENAKSVINIVNAGSGTAYGLRGGKENTITNSGTININNIGKGTAIGIYGEENSRINNSGTINIIRQTYKDPETGAIYRPQSAYGGTAYGIYAKSGASVINSGNITVTGAAKGLGIYLEDGATLVNNGKVTFNGALQNTEDSASTSVAKAVNLDDMGGEIILDKNGSFFADKLAGNLSISKNTVLNSFEDEYVLQNSLQAKDIDNLKLNSKSAMFKTETAANDTNGYDVVLKRQSFNSLLDDKNIAAFLENNYKDKNGSEIYNSLKQSETDKELRKSAANLHGTDVLPSFRRENALVYRHLNRQFNDNLFNRPDEHYIGGYKYMDISMDADGTLSDSDGTANAAYGMLTGKTESGLIYGLGATAANLKSDYDNGADRKSNVFGLWAPVGYDFKNGAKWISKAYLGYADGSYDRKTSLGKYSADTKEYQYGLSNEMRYKMNLGNGFSFEPAAELNFLGIYQDAVSEGSSLGALHIDSNNSLSLEGALGAYLGKDFQVSENGKLGIQIGGVYYVEFLDPDDGMDASMSGMNGKFRLKNKAQSDRALLSLRMNYNYKDLTLYGMIEKETGGSKAFTVDAGLQYKF